MLRGTMRNGRTKTAVRASSAKTVAKPANSRDTDAYLRHLGERVRTLRNPARHDTQSFG